MTIRVPLVTLLIGVASSTTFAQPPQAPAPRRITLSEALDLALQHNHVVRIARSSVEEKQRVKDVARSAYFPSVRADSAVVHLTDTQFIALPTGSLGVVGTQPIPPQTLIINQGALTTTTFGTGVTQPLTQLLKIKAANDVARADVEATQQKSQGIENSVALKVHQIYYRILIAELRRNALDAKIRASEDVQSERVQQVKYGSALEQDLIESRAQVLQAKQELLSTDLQLSDLRMELNDVTGLPLTTELILDPNVGGAPESCPREECLRLALQSHPEIAEARAGVEKARSAVRLAKFEFIPDVEAFARYSYQNNVPFLAQNFGTLGVRFSYNLFDGGRKRATVGERNAQLRQAEENLARISDEIELRVQMAYNKLERTKQMVAVSLEVLALRAESRRTSAEQVAQGSALRSQGIMSIAQELEASALLLQSQLDYVQAADEMDEAIGRTPR
jgi:outer membrane protein TolC